MRFIYILFALCFFACTTSSPNKEQTSDKDYFRYSEGDAFNAGVRMIPIQTPKGEFKVWTKRIGNNPKIKVLLLHGGPGCTHEYFECFDTNLPKEGIEYIYYDQLDSYYSDQPKDSSLWTIEHYVEEVEQVRKALGLNKDNFFLLGHSWGGILAIEYALKYQEHLKGLIISNMVASIPEYIKYANEVLGPQLPEEVVTQIKAYEAAKDYTNPKYHELVQAHYYTKHILRRPLKEWPDPVNRAFKHLNYDIYLFMQGPSEFGIVGDATLKKWNRFEELKTIQTPTLCLSGTYDTMDPKYMEKMSKQLPKGQYHNCPQGSHMAFYDDQKSYFKGLVAFLNQ